jgi:tetratricopeptide (TPR) repeat protein
MNDMDLRERKAFLSQVEEYFATKNYRTAMEIAQSRLSRAPGDLDARMVICRIFIQQGRIDEVREILSEMEEILASLAQVYACMGNICRKKGLHESAELFDRKYRILNADAPDVRDESARLMEIAVRQKTLSAEQKEAEAAPADSRTAIFDECDLRNSHLSLAEEVLKGILHKDSQQDETLEKLVEVRELARQETTAKGSTLILTELSRWLENIRKLSDAAEPEGTTRPAGGDRATSESQ